MGRINIIRHSLIFLILGILAASKCVSSTISELETQHQSFRSVVEDVKQEISTVEQIVSKYETKLTVARGDLSLAKQRVDSKQRTLTDLELNYFESPSEPLKRSIRQGIHGLGLAIRGEKSKTKRVLRIEGKLIKSQNVSSMLKQEKSRMIAKIELIQKDIKVAKSAIIEPIDTIEKIDSEVLKPRGNKAEISKLMKIKNKQPLNQEVLSEIVAPLAVNNKKSSPGSDVATLLAIGSDESIITDKPDSTKKSVVTEDDEKDNEKLKKSLKKLSQFRQWR